MQENERRRKAEQDVAKTYREFAQAVSKVDETEKHMKKQFDRETIKAFVDGQKEMGKTSKETYEV